MNRSLPIASRATVAVTACLYLAMAISRADAQDYQAPNFAGLAGQQFHQASHIPAFPASPLAGGPAAARGGEFVDVQGNPIVVQTQFEQPCPPAFAGGIGGGYGDPMAIDFGGYGEEQVGPHYFDVSAGVVFLQSERSFEGLLPFTAAGIGSPDFFLDPASDFGEYEPGWEIAGRYDVGALAVVEAAYMGLYDISFSDTVLSTEVAAGNAPFSLVSVFSNFGIAPIDGIDAGSVHSVGYEADLQSTEINYRRYWVGHNPRVSGTFMLGARYIRFTDEFQFDSTGLVAAAPQTARLDWSGENDMVGFHFGGDAWIGLRQGLRFGAEGSAGVYNNRYKFANSGTFSALTAPDDFANTAEGDQVAFATEVDVSFVADVLPSWSLRGGYRVMYLSSLVTASNNISQAGIGAGLLSTQDSLFFHGFHGGLEYVW